jgi:hypothetical protein
LCLRVIANTRLHGTVRVCSGQCQGGNMHGGCWLCWRSRVTWKLLSRQSTTRTPAPCCCGGNRHAKLSTATGWDADSAVICPPGPPPLCGVQGLPGLALLLRE